MGNFKQKNPKDGIFGIGMKENAVKTLNGALIQPKTFVNYFFAYTFFSETLRYLEQLVLFLYLCKKYR